jgi:hypothetical protein
MARQNQLFVIGEYWRRDSAHPGQPAWRSRDLRRGTSFRFPASHFRETINHQNQSAARALPETR